MNNLTCFNMKKILLIAAMAFVSAAGFAQNKFAHVNFSELVQLMPEADEARATMTASSNEAQETYQAMVDEYQTKMTEYQQKASTWTQTIRESKENSLMDMQQRIQEFEQNVQQELALQQNQLMAPIYDKAQQALLRQERRRVLWRLRVFRELSSDVSARQVLGPARFRDGCPVGHPQGRLRQGILHPSSSGGYMPFDQGLDQQILRMGYGLL